jgi:AcrR family transcriptional regulator
MPRAEREEQMLAAASGLFAERGYAHVSMDAVAARSGITKPLLYSYFGSKEGLYAACIRGFLAPLEERVEEHLDFSVAPDARLWGGLRALFAIVDEHRAEWKSFYFEPAAHGEQAAAAVEESRARAIERLSFMFGNAIREAGMPEAIVAEAPHQVHIFVGGVESLMRWSVEHAGEATPEVLALRVLNQVWMGFGDLLEGRLWTPDVS